jgi:hypothetical protein
MLETKATWEFSGTRIDLGALEYVRINLFYAYRVVKRQFFPKIIPTTQRKTNVGNESYLGIFWHQNWSRRIKKC